MSKRRRDPIIDSNQRRLADAMSSGHIGRRTIRIHSRRSETRHTAIVHGFNVKTHECSYGLNFTTFQRSHANQCHVHNKIEIKIICIVLALVQAARSTTKFQIQNRTRAAAVFSAHRNTYRACIEIISKPIIIFLFVFLFYLFFNIARRQFCV